MMRARLTVALVVALVGLMLVVTGCAGTDTPAGAVPESASQVPASAIAYVSLTTDEGSEQWQKADRLLGLFPGARDDLLGAFRKALADEGLTWERDVAPALGPEVVVVATAEKQPVLLTKPDDPAKLAALLTKGGEDAVSGDVGGWTAVAQEQAVLDAYRTALERGTLASAPAFVDALDGLPADALARVWVDGTALTSGDGASSTGSGSDLGQVSAFGLPLPDGLDLGLESIAAAVAAQDDGLLLSMALRSARAVDGTRYSPTLVTRTPGDAVAAFSFGGSQSTFDRVRGAADGVSQALESAVGISLERVLDALSGEGVVYLRRGTGKVPEVTVVLAPPDAGKTFTAVDDAIRKLAADQGVAVTTATEAGVAVSSVDADGVTLRYARPDSDTVIVTTGATGIADFLSTAETKLTATDAYRRAADSVGLGDLTRGFLYVDIDGLVPLIDAVAGADAVPSGAREVLGKLDAFVLQADGDGKVTRLTGFVRVNG